MSGLTEPSSVKLCLNERDKIFIKAKLNQYQIDGIRFLYKQFQKDKPGVILNNSPNYENLIFITHFLRAIHNTKDAIKKPVLIACNEEKKNEWFEHFQNMSQSNDVVLMAPHPFVKKYIFIHTVDDIIAFCGRHWSVVVVDSDALIMDKALLAKFKADFKIWNTSLDCREEHLKAFKYMYDWIYPKENLSIDDYKPQKGDSKDELQKKIILEAILEDALFKYNFGISDVTPLPSNKNEIFPKVTNKNKDATGTKVKRSKRQMEEKNLNSTYESNVINTDVSATKIAKRSSDTSNNSNSLDNAGKSNEVNLYNMDVDGDISDVETFIQNKNPIINNFYNEIHDFDITGEQSIEYNENDNSVVNIHNNKNNSEMLIHKTANVQQANVVTAPTSSDDNAYELETHVVNIKYTSKDINEGSDYVQVDETISKETEVITNVASTDSDEDAYNLETQVLIVDNTIKVINEGSDHVKVDNKIDEEDVNNDDIKNINQDFARESFDRCKINSDCIRNEVVEVKNLNVSNSALDNKPENSEKCKDTKNTNYRQDLDSKIIEHEDRIFKKFKGTFLDSIF